MNVSPELMKAHGIFYPYALKQRSSFWSGEKKFFVHYTDASALLSIVENKEIWLRNATCMNDFSEVEHGLECLASAYKSDVGKQFQETLEKIQDGLCKEIEELFDGWSPTFAKQTYLFCLSEHLPEEFDYGRLSMWRAYGQGTGIALILKSAPFLQASDALNAYTIPVGYFDEKSFLVEFSTMSKNVSDNLQFVTDLGKNELKGYIFELFKYAALCIKHPGFKEEREWRIVHTDKLDPSRILTKDIKVFRGTPQSIYKLPMENVPEKDLTGIEIPEIIERVIIGPTEYPGATRDAIIYLLEKANVSNAAEKVVVSTIPLR